MRSPNSMGAFFCLKESLRRIWMRRGPPPKTLSLRTDPNVRQGRILLNATIGTRHHNEQTPKKAQALQAFC